MKKKRIIRIFLLIVLFSFSCILFAWAANADVSGVWQLVVQPPPIIVHVVRNEVWNDGSVQSWEFNQNYLLYTLYACTNIQINQAPDGIFLGSCRPDSGTFITIEGKIKGNSITFKRHYESSSSSPRSASGKVSIDENYVGIVLSSGITTGSGSVSGTLKVEDVSHTSNSTFYETSSGNLISTFSFLIVPPNSEPVTIPEPTEASQNGPSRETNKDQADPIKNKGDVSIF